MPALGWVGAEAWKAAAGVRVYGDSRLRPDRVFWDSRAVEINGLFVALGGERFDGHDFLEAVYAQGGRAFLVRAGRQDWAAWAASRPGVQVLEAVDPLAALQDAARAHRRRCAARRVGITGSSGKTSTKELLAALAGPQAYATEGNYNGDLGLAVTLLGLPETAPVAVLEMGIGRPGEMDELAAMAEPEVGVITHIGSAHAGPLGGRAGIAREKRKILSRMTAAGVAVLPRDDEYSAFLAAGHPGRVDWFGLQDAAGLELRGLEGSVFFYQGHRVQLNLPGRFQVLNALAALRAAEALGLNWKGNLESWAQITPLKGRTVLRKGRRTVLEDCYNANAESMAALLELLTGLEADRRTLGVVLGAMRELGPESEAAHRRLGLQAAALVGSRPGTQVLFFGEETRSAYEAFTQKRPGEGFWTESFEALAQETERRMPEGSLVALKGSRALALERLTEQLL